MSCLNFKIAPEVLGVFPEMRVSAIRIKGLEAALASFDGAGFVTTAAQNVARTFETAESLVADPRIDAWRKAYGAIGAKPSKFRSSIEALARRAVKGAPLSTNIPVVDLYNAVSLETLAPLGVYDAALLPSGGLALRCANPDQDQFNPLGATADDFPLHKELVVYAADNKVLCWGFNCRDSRDVCLSETTDEAVFFGEAAFAVQHEALRQALTRLQTLFREKGAECGAIETASHATPSFSV